MTHWEATLAIVIVLLAVIAGLRLWRWARYRLALRRIREAQRSIRDEVGEGLLPVLTRLSEEMSGVIEQEIQSRPSHPSHTEPQS